MSYGMKSSLGINFQNSYGTTLTSSIYWLPYLSEGLTLKKEQLISEGRRGIFDEGASYEGMNSIEGDIEVEAHPVTLGVLLKAAFGAPSTVTSTGVYTHTFKPRTSDFDAYAANIPLSIVRVPDDTGSAHQYYDMVASKISFGVANGEFQKVTMSVIGGKYSQVAAPTVTLPTGDTNFTWAVASLSLGGPANADMKELTVEVDESLENIFTLNSAKTPSRTKRTGYRVINISGTLVFDNQTEYQKFVAQSDQALILTMTTATQIQSGYYESFTVKAPRLRYTEFPISAGDAGKMEVGFTSKADYSTTSATALELVLVNSKAAY